MVGGVGGKDRRSKRRQQENPKGGMELVCVCVCVCWQANLYSKILVSSSHGRAHIVKSIPHLHCWICSTDFIQNSHF